MLLLMGLYDGTMRAITEFRVPFLLTLGLGLILGIVLTTKLLERAMQRHPEPTYLIILGFSFRFRRSNLSRYPVGLGASHLSDHASGGVLFRSGCFPGGRLRSAEPPDAAILFSCCALTPLPYNKKKTLRAGAKEGRSMEDRTVFGESMDVFCETVERWNEEEEYSCASKRSRRFRKKKRDYRVVYLLARAYQNLVMYGDHGSGTSEDTEEIETCMKKALELLSTPSGRRASTGQTGTNSPPTPICVSRSTG